MPIRIMTRVSLLGLASVLGVALGVHEAGVQAYGKTSGVCSLLATGSVAAAVLVSVLGYAVKARGVDRSTEVIADTSLVLGLVAFAFLAVAAVVTWVANLPPDWLATQEWVEPSKVFPMK